MSGRRDWSLTTVLTVWHAGAALLLAGASLILLSWGLTRFFEQLEDQVLHERIRVLRALIQEGNSATLRWEVELEQQVHEWPLVYVRILGRDGKRYLESPGMAEFLPVEAIPHLPSSELMPPSRNIRRAGRILHLTVATAPGPPDDDNRPYIIQAALDSTEPTALLRRYRFMLLIIVAGATLLSLWFVRRLSQKALRPLDEIVLASQQVRGSALDVRIPETEAPEEIATLARNFNHMLDRLEESYNRLRRFSDDIAHELQTPLSNMRGEAEVALSKARSIEEYRDVLLSCLEEAEDLSEIIARLLFLAEAERDEMRVEPERIQLASGLAGLMEFFEPAAWEKGIHLSVECSEHLWLEADRLLFLRAVSNLVTNALAATPAGGTIYLAGSQEDSTVCVEVRDTGIGIPPEHLPQIFERFYRVERSGSKGSGVGLGLSIVKSIMNLHRGSIEILAATDGGTRVLLKFPPMTES